MVQEERKQFLLIKVKSLTKNDGVEVNIFDEHLASIWPNVYKRIYRDRKANPIDKCTEKAAEHSFYLKEEMAIVCGIELDCLGSNLGSTVFDYLFWGKLYMIFWRLNLFYFIF